MKTLITVALAVTGICFAVSSFFAGRVTAHTSRHAAPPPVAPLGHEAPAPGFMSVNGWNIPQDPPFAATYQSLRSYLGVPIGAFDGQSQPFWGGRLISIPTNGPAHQVILDDLGREYLLLRNFTPVPDSEPDPIVLRLILDAAQTGYNPPDLFGRIISPLICDHDTPKHCEQYTDKQLVSWTVGDTVAKRQALGCLLSQACSRLQFPPPPPPESSFSRLFPLAAGVLLLLVALALFVSARLHQGEFASESYGG